MKNLTIGMKLKGGVGVLFALVVALGGYSMFTNHRLGREVQTAREVDALKEVLTGRLDVAISDMLSMEKAILLRTSFHDATRLESNKQMFVEAAKKAQAAVDELRPLLQTENGSQFTNSIADSLQTWLPMHERMLSLCQTDFEGAHRLHDERILPMGNAMKRSAEELITFGRKYDIEATHVTLASVERSRWINILMIVLSAGMGLVFFLLVNRANRGLMLMADQMADASAQVSSATSQIASSSQTLAQGASQQAASVEETSASAEEIISMTRRNLEHTGDAARRMEHSANLIESGQKSLTEMVESMQQINESSNRISKIIRVIDEIAFQTNILSLNAAVEAARAGEAGKGFAVVADEVRNLAQRSAQAAKDTESLIQESIGRSDQGSQKLKQVVEAMNAITGSVEEVKALVAEVHAGSGEQANGMEQIMNAIRQIEKVTQNTAANAEESASASEQMAAQAASMRQTVGRLRSFVTGVGDEIEEPLNHARVMTPRPAAVSRPSSARGSLTLGPVSAADFKSF